jgi:hypothetical protein
MDLRLAILLLFVGITLGGAILVRILELQSYRRRKAQIGPIAKNPLVNIKSSIENAKNILERQRQVMKELVRVHPEMKEDCEEVVHKMQEKVRRAEELLAKMEISNGNDSDNPFRQQIPISPMLGFMTMINAWMIEVSVLFTQWISGGQFPSPLKVNVATGIFVISIVYHLTLRKRHQRYDWVLGKVKLGVRQKMAVVCWVVAWGLLLSWIV